MRVLFIHGALSTPTCWNYLKTKLVCEQFFLRYEMDEKIGDIIERGIELCAVQEIDAIVAHSMGGIIALHIARSLPRIKKVCTISTPIGGVKHAPIDFNPKPQPLFKDVLNNSPWIGTLAFLNVLKKEVEVSRLVTTAGHSAFMFEANDGVVTISSQMTNSTIPTTDIDLNHFEVLLDDRTIDWLRDQLAGL